MSMATAQRRKAIDEAPQTITTLGVATGDHGESGPSELLDSVARITVHRDIDTLDHSLVLSLAELTEARRVVLDKRIDAGGGRIRYSRAFAERAADGSYVVDFFDTIEPLPPTDPAAATVPVQHDKHAHIDLLISEPAHAAGATRLAEGFARIYGNYTSLINESERDKLTGLYNRRTLDRHLQRLLRAQAGSDAVGADDAPALWLAIFDIDHFKRINDTFGHLYGDEVILLLARRMLETFRAQDVLFRFGGEEFVALMPASDATTVGALLEQFRAAVDQGPFPQVGHVSVSIGYTRFGHSDHPELALERADKALYFAKEHGRNQVARYETLVGRGEVSTVSAGSVDLF